LSIDTILRRLAYSRPERTTLQSSQMPSTVEPASCFAMSPGARAALRPRLARV